MIKRTDYKVDLTNYQYVVFPDKMAINQPTGDFFYDPWKIKEEFKGTMWEEILSTLPKPHGEARVIVMQPGTTYMAHADIDNRWHLSLQGEQSYLIDLDNKQMHLLEQDGYWYYMDAGRIHAASNYGSIPRIQLVVRELLTNTTMPNLIDVTIEPRNPQHDYRYKFDTIVSPWLNSANQSKSLKDFSFNGNTVTFKTILSELDKLELTDNFKITTSNM